jgi:toxin ParE1/3/4
MAQLRWSRQALQDVDAIAMFIARDAPRTAKRFVQLIISAVEPLARQPKMGSIVPELRDAKIREIRFRRYRIVYHQPNDDLVEILTHGARLLELDFPEQA